MDLRSALVRRHTNGLRYVENVKAACSNCGQSCRIIFRPELVEYMHYLSDCCSRPVRVNNGA